jgi:hypothetical protein
LHRKHNLKILSVQPERYNEANIKLKNQA